MENKQKSVIYLIFNEINGKCYVGESKNYPRRWEEHRSEFGNTNCKYPIHRAFNKHGLENFSFSILEYCSEENLKEEEIWWIAYLKSLGALLYNITNGGDGIPGYRHTEETKNLISQQKKELYASGWEQPEKSQEYLDNMRGRMIGHKINIGRKHGPDCGHCKILKDRNLNNNPSKQPIKDATRAKMSSKKVGSKNNYSKMTEEKVFEIRKLKSEGISIKELSNKFEIAERTVRGICNYSSWKHVK